MTETALRAARPAAPASGPPTPPAKRWDWRPKLRWFASEYLIVVLGVLTAVALNAWWQGRQDRALETRSLREVRDALARDLPDIRWNAGFHERSRDSARLLREHLRARRPYSDTLDAHFGHVLGSTFSIRDETAYETLKQRGLDTVTDDSLRVAIGHVYGVSYPALILNQAWLGTYVHEQEVPFYGAHFRDLRWGETATPVDYDALLDATEYAAILDWGTGQDAFLADWARDLDAEVTALIARIDAELSRR